MTIGTLKAILFGAVSAVSVAGAAALPGCGGIVNPAQQATDISNAVDCVKNAWGQTPEAVAAACLANSVPAAIDIISDIGALLAAAGIALPDAYVKDSRVSSAVLAKRQAAVK